MSNDQPAAIPDNAPWWAKGITAIGQAFGVSAILLAFYLGQSAGLIPNPVEERLSAMEGELQELKGIVVQGNATNKEIIQALKEQSQDRQMRCVLKAKTEDEKRQCFPRKEHD